MTKSDDKASQYAINVIERGTSATAHELDRLHAMVTIYEAHLQYLSDDGDGEAYETLRLGRKL